MTGRPRGGRKRQADCGRRPASGHVIRKGVSASYTASYGGIARPGAAMGALALLRGKQDSETTMEAMQVDNTCVQTPDVKRLMSSCGLPKSTSKQAGRPVASR